MNNYEYIAIREKHVIKSNALIQKSRFSLSLIQQKIILYLISQISPYDKEFKEYEFNIRDFCKVCGIDYESGGNYSNLKKQIQPIRDHSVWVTLPDGTETTVSWIAKPYINAKSGKIRIKIDEDMRPYLLELKKNFTRYELVYTLHFKSKYTIRLYELIKSLQYNDLKPYEHTYSVEDLKRLLDGEKYNTYQHFRERVLDIAVREINEYSDKILSYEPVKKGRKITGIKFNIQSKDIKDIIDIRVKIDEEMSYNPDQLSIWDGVSGTDE